MVLVLYGGLCYGWGRISACRWAFTRLSSQENALEAAVP